MNLKSYFCHAFKWFKEPPGLCCSGGKVFFAEIADPPEPLKSFSNHSHRYFKYFLDVICVYNSVFQLTSLGVNEIKHGDLMPTFKVHGQVYHLGGFLLPNNSEEPKVFANIFYSSFTERSIIANVDNDLQYLFF